MGKIQRFEDIEAWRKARELAKAVYEMTSHASFSKDFGLRDQARRAAVSVMSNIAEGFERGGNKEFRQFLSTAKGSAGEVRSQLYVGLDVGFLDKKTFEDLAGLAKEVGRMIGGLMRYIEKSGHKGSKFKDEL